MRVPAGWIGLGAALLCALPFAVPGRGQNPNPPASHVVIPNPTPRPPDLEKEYGDDAKEQQKRTTASIKSQLRAREIWLESNQILLLAQQLQQLNDSGKMSSSMAAGAAKAGQIEKLARTVQQNMKAH